MTKGAGSGRGDDRRARPELRSERLRSLIREDAPRVESGTALAEAIATMQEHGGDSLLVLSRGRLVGVLTERDVLLKVLGRGIDEGSMVDGVMTPKPDTLSGDHTLVDALELMDRSGARTIVLEAPDGSIEGVIRQRDILEFVAEAFPEEILNLPPRPHQVAGTAEGG
jgi:CBS domain-containing protein